MTAPTPPAPVVKLGRLAYGLGWTVAVVYADGPPPTVSLRIGRGQARAWGLWQLGDGCKWKGGAANRIPGGHLPTVGKFTTYIEEAA